MSTAKTTMPDLVWKPRARRDETLTSLRRTWETACGRYQVQESVSKFGLPKVYYALFCDKENSDVAVSRIISRHLVRTAAEKACVAHQRASVSKEKPRRKEQ